MGVMEILYSNRIIKTQYPLVKKIFLILGVLNIIFGCVFFILFLYALLKHV